MKGLLYKLYINKYVVTDILVTFILFLFFLQFIKEVLCIHQIYCKYEPFLRIVSVRITHLHIKDQNLKNKETL